jgi:serine/threonine-protein kinase
MSAEPSSSLSVSGTSQPSTVADPALAAGAEATPTGRYRSLQLHAQGGLGEVFLAVDEELQRPVALKRIRAEHAADADSRRRFLREAEITALLEHPGVVPVHGLVHDAAGQPHYAMRFVQGESLRDAIRRYHDGEPADPAARRLAFRKLLQHFLAVCHTVGYAHSRGVIHRDLKPGNVLLGKFGETLVSDWGLAKVVGRTEATFSDAEQTLQTTPATAGDETQLGQVLGTPAYMSPEQAAGRWDVVGPASDLYGLGAVLYHLLTGRAPVQGQNTPEVLAQVQRGDIPRPRAVNPAVPPALEAVCRKALAREPQDRYATAAALAAEVEQWLADEPVAAYREPLGARLGRWARRHKPLLAGAAALLTAAVVALGGLAWQSERARQRLVAEQQQTEAARLLAVQREEEAKRNAEEAGKNERQARLFEKEGREAFQKYFIEVSEDNDLKAVGLEPLRKKLLEHAREYYQKFVAERGQDPSLQAELAYAVFRLGYITSEIGNKEDAIDDYKRALDLYQKLHDEHPTVTQYASALAQSHNNLGNLYRETGWPKYAEAAYQKALAVQQKLHEQHPTVTGYASDLAKHHGGLGNLYQQTDRPKDAEAAYQNALAIQQKLHEQHPTVTGYASALAQSHHNLGFLYRETGRPKDAEVAYQKALAIQQQLHEQHPTVTGYVSDLAKHYAALGLLYRQTGRPKDAEVAYQKALALRQQLHDDHPTVTAYAIDLGGTLCNLGHLRRDQGQPEDALDFYARAIATLEEVLNRDQRHTTARLFLRNSHQGRARTLGQLQRHGEAAKDWERAIELDDGRQWPYFRLQRAVSLARAGEHEPALRQAEELLRQEKLAATTLYDLACVHALCAAASKQEEPAARAVELLRQAVAKGYKDVARLKKDSDLDSLRPRDDFRQLLEALAAKQP